MNLNETRAPMLRHKSQAYAEEDESERNLDRRKERESDGHEKKNPSDCFIKARIVVTPLLGKCATDPQSPLLRSDAKTEIV